MLPFDDFVQSAAYAVSFHDVPLFLSHVLSINVCASFSLSIFSALAREIPTLCSGASFLAFVAIDAVKISAVFSVLCRYLIASCPYSRLALFLLKRENFSVLIWPIVVVLNLPQAFLHEGQTDVHRLTLVESYFMFHLRSLFVLCVLELSEMFAIIGQDQYLVR